jgi:hypothetical protein
VEPRGTPVPETGPGGTQAPQSGGAIALKPTHVPVWVSERG